MKNNVLNLKDKVFAICVILMFGMAGMMGLVAQPAGAINGLFSIAEGQYVCFSQGNLQYQASTNTWRFAEHQWDVVDGSNSNISPTYSGWIDLFGWGTSGYNHGAVCYQPWSTSTTDADYYAYGEETYNLHDGNGRADWGYNKISNGGNQYGLWRTLTVDEWNYILNGRSTNSGYRYVKATVNDVKGLILLPDSWNVNLYTLGRANAHGAQFSANVISASDWTNIFEAHGAVFLPVANYRNGSTCYNHTYGYYHTSSPSNGLFFYDGSSYGIGASGVNLISLWRYYGCSVRLVRAPNQIYTISTGVTPSTGGKVTGAGQYMAGTLCTLHATPNGHYTFIRWRKNGSQVSTNPTYSFTVSGSDNYVAEFAAPVGGNGQLDGIFSVTPNYKVCFSKGNLQYQANTHTWRFAMNQYECMGNDNQNVSSSYSGWIDLFCWGTSGYNHGANCYQPWSISNNDGDYYAYGQSSYNLFNQTGDADWGYNAISNGGNSTNSGWRTLTQQEWYYLFNSRTTPSGIRYSKATVNGVSGVILFPDNWNSSLYDLSDINNADADYINNIITDNDWTNTFEPAGAVFLPANGRMESGNIVTESYSDFDYGYYWSSTKTDDSYARGVKFSGGRVNGGTFFLNDGYLDNSYPINRHYAVSVRLARYADGYGPSSYSINVSASPSNGGTVGGGGSYQEGSNCTVSATANSGYTFSNWTENGNVVSTNATYTFTVTRNRTLMANFEEEASTQYIKFDLYDSYGDGWNGNKLVVNYGNRTTEQLTISSGSSATHNLQIPNGSHVTLTWIMGSKTEECSFKVSYPNGNNIYLGSNLSDDFTYSFDVDYNTMPTTTYNISVSTNPSNGGTVSGAGSYNCGSSCTLNATAKAGYTFVNWTENGNIVSTNTSYTFTVTGNRTLVSNFKTTVLLTSLSDDFDDGVINSGYWTTTGNNVCEEEGLIKLQQNVTDDNVSLESVCMAVPANNQIVIDRSFLIHERQYNTSLGSYFFYGSITVKLNGSNDDYVGVSYYDDDYENRHGVYIRVRLNGEFNETRICDATFDTWLTEKLVINISDETFAYYLDNALVSTLNVAGLSSQSIEYYTVIFSPYGWWTGHYHNMDYININTATPVSYDIQVTANPTGGGNVSGGGTYQQGQTCTLTATANSGYTFSNWTENGNVVSTNSNYNFTVTGDRTLIANFTAIPENYNISVSVNPSSGGTVSGAGTYQEGSTCILTATPATGYSFVRWTKNGTQVSTNPSYSFTVTGNASYEAVFTLNSYTVSVSTNPVEGGTVSGGGTYSHGSSCTLTATANVGYTFSNWTENGNVVSTNSNYNFTVTGDRTLIANFTAIPENYNISVSVNPSSGGTVSGAGTYQEGSTCILTATPATGYSFVRWTKNGTQVSTNPSYSFTVTENASYVAVFSPNSYTVSVSANPSVGGTVSGGGTYSYGSSCTLTATANAGYTFVSWTENGMVSTAATYGFTVTGNRTLVANFVSTETNVTEGALNGLFSVGENITVRFSQGNLQYIGSAGNGDANNIGAYWKFAEHQWDYLGNNGQGSDSPTANRDLFGWGTSGYNHGAVCYQPWSTSESSSDYYAYGSDTYNLFDQTGQADWGYNAISNGGNQENSGWRTLTQSEWSYIFNTRSTTSGIRFAMANVNNVNGVILLPDDWSTSYYTLNNTNSSSASFNSNIITVEQWNAMEQFGAVFLPSAGSRSGTSVINVGSHGYYWSSSYSRSDYACGVGFFDSNLYTFISYRSSGLSVRLARNYSFVINATPNPAEGGTVSGAGVYAEGTECTLTATANEGYTFVIWTENGEVVSTEAVYSFTVTGNRTLVANFASTGTNVTEGVLNGLFSVGENTTVRFSQGNLQYIGSAGTPYWKFADNQWNILGATTGQGSSVQNINRDLFGWGTSGYNHGAVCYQPWSTSTSSSDYYAYGSDTYNLFDQTGQADWGYNAISNGGNQENSGWRTLTWSELYYLFNKRSTTSGIRFAKAKVNDVNGVILLPDDWQSSYYSLSNTNTSGASFSSNTITATQWATLEQHGAVFLPAAGDRFGTSVYGVGSYGYYWSASYEYITHGAEYVGFDDSHLHTGSIPDRDGGFSVRLARVASSFVINAVPNPAEGGAVSGAGAYAEGVGCTLTATANTGYNFVRWTKNGSQVSTNSTYSFTVTENASYVAVFSPNSYTISASASPSNGGSVSGAGACNYGSTCTLTATPATGYNFVRWTKNGQQVSTNPTYSFTVTEDASYVAVFGLNSYTVSASANPSSGGSVSGGGTYNYGSYCTLKATPATYYNFVRWTKNGSQVSTNPRYTFRVTENANYEAVFNIDSYTISTSVSPSNGGTVNGAGTYTNGSSCTLTATPATGYNFVRWTKNGSQVSTNPSYSFTVTGNASYVAVFSLNSYTVSVSANPSAGGTVSGGGTYDYGSFCTLTATAAEGYTFVSWTENGEIVSTDPTYSFTVTGDRTLSANFELTYVTHTTALSSGWNWWSANIDITLDDLKSALVSALGNTPIQIKSKDQSVSYTGSRWRGTLTSLDVTRMYKIRIALGCEITLSGAPINPEDHPITIHNGVNWIGYPFAEPMSVSAVFSGFAANGDLFKSRDLSTSYNGSRWRGTLYYLEPGKGYIYKSAVMGDRTFVFPLGQSRSVHNSNFGGK